MERRLPPSQPVRADGQAGGCHGPGKADPRRCTCTHRPPSVCIFFWHVFPGAASFSRTLCGIWHLSPSWGEREGAFPGRCRTLSLKTQRSHIFKLILVNHFPLGPLSVSTPHSPHPLRVCNTHTHVCWGHQRARTHTRKLRVRS